MKVSVHQDSVLSLMRFIIVLEALSCEFCSGFPWEDLFAGDLGIITELLEECVRRLLTWKEAMEEKGLSKCREDKDLDLWYGPGPPEEFRRVSMCSLSHWSGQQQHLLKQLQALSAQEMQRDQVLGKGPRLQMYTVPGNCMRLGSRPQRKVQVQPIELEMEAFSCCLRDMLSAADGCELSITTRVKTAWKKFKELLSALSSRHLSFKTCGHVYSSCVQSAKLHANETWLLTKPNLQHLQQNDRAMIRQICKVKPQDIVTTRSNELLASLGIEDLDLILKERLSWYDIWTLQWCSQDSLWHTG